MIKMAGINFHELSDEEFDEPFGIAQSWRHIWRDRRCHGAALRKLPKSCLVKT